MHVFRNILEYAEKVISLPFLKLEKYFLHVYTDLRIYIDIVSSKLTTPHITIIKKGFP